MFVSPGATSVTTISPAFRPSEYERQSKIDFDSNEMKRLFALREQMGRAGTCWIHTPWEELKLPAKP